MKTGVSVTTNAALPSDASTSTGVATYAIELTRTVGNYQSETRRVVFDTFVQGEIWVFVLS